MIKEIFQQLLVAHGNSIQAITATDQEGFWLTPEKITSDQLASTIAPLLSNYGWIYSAIRPNKVLIEPVQSDPAGWDRSNFCFHVSPTVNRRSIVCKGLELRTGGNTVMNRRTPDPRIYVARDLLCALEFVQFQCGDRLTRVPEQQRRLMREIASITTTTRENLDIWRVKLPEAAIVRRDVLFPGKAGYVEQPISPQRLRRLHWWRTTEKMWQIGRRRGWV